MGNIDEPPRLWQDAHASPALRAAMRAGRDDKAGGRRLAAIAAGLSAGGIPVAHAATATTVALAVKLVVVAVTLAGAAGAGLLIHLNVQSPKHAPAQHRMTAKVTMPATATMPTMPTKPIVAAPAAEPLRVRSVPQRRVATRNALPTPLEESLWLEDVRKLLASNPTEALARLARYKRRFAAPVLEQEATVMRVQALVGTEQWHQAKSESDQFLRQHPESPHRSALMRALEQRP